MKAVFHTGVAAAWGTALGARPWCLAPVGGKPLVEYWIEWAANLAIHDIRLVLGDGAEAIEAYCGDGSRWGLRITYGFFKKISDPEAYLRRSPGQWKDGLLYLAAPVFPRRLQDPKTAAATTSRAPEPEGSWLLRTATGATACFLSRQTAVIQSLIDGQPFDAHGQWTELDLEPVTIGDVNAYYTINMRLVGGEIVRYVPPGFGGGEGAYIGSNVIIPPSVELRPPLAIGNDCRIQPMAVIGPNVVIGNGVIVDRQTELSGSVVMDGTYLGRNLEIRNRVVSGARLVLPEDGTVIELEDPWLLAQLPAPARIFDCVRTLCGWSLAVALALLQAVPFALLYALLRFVGGGGYRRSPRLAMRSRVLNLPVWSADAPDAWLNRLFTGLSLDVFPLIVLAAAGQLGLCGHRPLHPEHDSALRKRLRRYYPAAIHYESLDTAESGRSAAANALYYEHYRSLAEDLRILFRFLFGRLMALLACSAPDRRPRQTSDT
jgi:hypothetical protein